MVDIFDHPGYKIDKSGNIYSLRGKLKILKTWPDTRGYPCIKIPDKDKKKKKYKIHRLVAIHFIPNPHNKPCVNHKNGIKYM